MYNEQLLYLSTIASQSSWNWKNALITPSTNTLPSTTGKLTLDVDACDVRMSSVQLDRITKPIEYWSRSLTKAKRK